MQNESKLKENKRKESKLKLSETKRLLAIMAQLRDKESGCPWDVKQTMESLTRYTIEEAYEVADAIASGDMGDIKDELGDLLFQVVFYAQIAKEQDAFSFDDVAQGISDKLVRRHPHVFGDTKSSDTLSDASLNAQWEAIKAQEKRAKKATSNSVLDNVPSGMPALMHAQKLQKACAKVGFDWPELMPVLDKVREEVDEIAQEIHIASKSQSTEAGDTLPLNHDAIEEEIGDALFAMVNLSRHLNVDADTALRKASHKFAARFKGVEQLAREQGTELDTMSLEEMETLWQTIKRNS
ncbi:nucleoside triphosphate pyrophosphohydrolase [Alteromonas sp. 009811495]|uniref:nucleoside triphosphate pyrophosphohydrolase n=1 Tax=Alteromonas sp. 009811495 TaxID=3002962 RepID=UPI00237E5D5A|nr:nucleoside triphosphate pyrophosphohydrolase [Alteromonas sp. 009811495]WDT86830.1 nucleoside triphosphate pyrophosphohydrolase [Alteromonas sp. 009811495]